jgi:polar amino acid transport system substrate-binding protein
MTRRLSASLALIILAAVAAFAACNDGASDPAGQTPNPGVTQEAIDISGVPELSDGTLTVGSDLNYSPMEFIDDVTGEQKGLDIDIMRAIGDLLGVHVEFQQVDDFAGIVPDLTAVRYDAIMAALSITPERQTEIDLIPYFGPVGTGILVSNGNPKQIANIESLCGLNVSALDGSFQVRQVHGDAGAPGLNATTCAEKPINLSTFPDDPTAVNELLLGRVDAHLSDDPVAAYTASQAGSEIELASVGFEAVPYGIGVRKTSTALKAVLEQGFQRIRENGSYQAILQSWFQERFALP